MKKKRSFIITVMLAVTGMGMGIISGYSYNQEELTWPEVMRDIRNKYPDIKQLRTEELHSWLSNPQKKSVFFN